jgi:hypothetical protein
MTPEQSRVRQRDRRELERGMFPKGAREVEARRDPDPKGRAERVKRMAEVAKREMAKVERNRRRSVFETGEGR